MNQIKVVLVTLVFLSFSCKNTEEVNPDNGYEKPQLVLSASSFKAKVGDTVFFNVSVMNETVAANIFVDNQKILVDNYVFDSTGAYKVYAEKKNYQTSNKIEIIIEKEERYQTSVYVSGYKYEGYNENQSALYWKNGVPNILIEGVPKAETNNIVVYNGNVYVSGTVYDGQKGYIQYWENGIPKILATSINDTLKASSLTIDQGDVYMSGNYYTSSPVDPVFITYWKNSSANPFFLGQGIGFHELVSDVKVNNGNVYVLGRKNLTLNSNYKLVYWKNGKEYNLAQGNFSKATSMAVKKDTIFAVGYKRDGDKHGFNRNYVAKLWISGEGWTNTFEQSLADPSSSSKAKDIVIHNRDIYIAGYKEKNGVRRAVYWKNGKLIELTSLSDQCTATAIAIDGEDIYVTGFIDKGSKKIAVYWKNGKPTVLSDGIFDAKATGVFIAHE